MSARKCRRQRRSRSSSVAPNRAALRRAIDWIVNDGIFADMRFHGNVKWTAVALVQLAIFWVWSNESSLVAGVIEAIAQVTAIWGRAAVGSYQALTGALKAYTA